VRPSALRGLPYSGEGAPRWRFGRFVRATVGRTALALFRVRFIGAENVPRDGAIIAGNHVSYLDPVLLWSGAPRLIHFMGKAGLWEKPWLGWLLDHFWTFPVRRGAADREAISTATHLLERGELVGIFPEGTRVRHGGVEALGEAQGGVAFIAMRAGVPVVPVGISGTERVWPEGQRLPRFPRITVRFCEPLHPEDFSEGSRKERVEAMTAEVMRHIVSARDEAAGEVR